MPTLALEDPHRRQTSQVDVISLALIGLHFHFLPFLEAMLLRDQGNPPLLLRSLLACLTCTHLGVSRLVHGKNLASGTVHIPQRLPQWHLHLG